MARKKSSAPNTRGFLTRWLRRVKIAFWLNLVAWVGGGLWYATQPEVRQTEVRRLVANAVAENKRVTPLDVVWDIYQLYYSPDFIATPPASGDRTHLYAGAPRVSGAKSAPVAGRFLKNTGYLVGYDDNLGAPRWVAYRIDDVDTLAPPGERPGGFETDLRTVARVAPEAFTGSGYDRGHLAPNYGIATRYGTLAQRETFLMSNIIPQRHGLNAGLWKQLELDAATNYPARFGEVWVLAGPVFAKNPKRLAGQPGKVRPAVPESCYMILVDESDGRARAMAFIFPQEPPDGAKSGDYLTTIDEIERLTALDFFADLPDETQAMLESRTAGRVW